MGRDESTHERVLGLIVSAGPVSAADLAVRLSLTPAGIRRHLVHLSESGHITEHEIPGRHERGPGRPPRAYVATPEGQKALTSAYSTVAVDAIDFLRNVGGLEGFITDQARRLERALEARIDPEKPLAERVEALAEALTERGYAASVRPLPRGLALQLCLGHCPVQTVAEAAPEWCESETRAISRILGLPVQRLSTLAGGAHVCTINVPLTLAGLKGAHS